MNTLEYKGYEGTAEIDCQRMVCRGKILFINDLVTYESKTIDSLKKEFEDAVDDYILTCADLGKEPQRPFKGQFNVRVSPAIHKAAAVRAAIDDISLNEIVARSLDAFLNISQDTNHHLSITVQMPNDEVRHMSTSSSGLPEWRFENVH